MSLAWISLAALATAVTLSIVTKVNVGVVSLALAWIVGVYIGDMSYNAVIGTFPVALFITLAGVTLLFGMANVNGTLQRLAARAVSVCRGNAGIIPVMFFVVALFLSSIGPGNIATAALLAPMGMAVGAQAGVPPFLTALMLGNGAQAGALSPFAPTGVIVNGVMDRIGLAGHQWTTYGNNLMAHVVITFIAYFLFGGWKLFTSARSADGAEAAAAEPFEPQHWLTIGVLAAVVLGVIVLNLQVGMAALVGATILSLAKAGDEKEAIKRMPWGVVLMVCGVTVLIGVLEKTQGMSLFTDLLASVSTPGTVSAIVAFATGIVSVYSSTSGVVLPAFLPMAPDLAQRLGGLDPVRIAWSINVGASLVDLSSLSTVGALFIAGAAPGTDTRALFNGLLVWGLAMSVVGAVLCWALFG
jgi:di/tricarboxylate transporter